MATEQNAGKVAGVNHTELNSNHTGSVKSGSGEQGVVALGNQQAKTPTGSGEVVVMCSNALVPVTITKLSCKKLSR